MYIALSGASCSGKTTTARLVAKQLDAHFCEGLEHEQEPIKSGSLFVHNDEAEFHVEQWFLDHHVALSSALPTEGSIVCDWSLESDLAYAMHYFANDAEKLHRFRKLYETARQAVRTPDVWIVLSAPIDILTQRKAARHQETARIDDKHINTQDLLGIQERHIELIMALPSGFVLEVSPDDTPERIAASILGLTDKIHT